MYLYAREIAARLGVKHRQWTDRLSKLPSAPAPHQPPGTRPMWDTAEVDEWWQRWKAKEPKRAA